MCYSTTSHQTTADKGFRELPTAEFTIHSYPAAPAIDVDTAKELHEFLGLGASLTDSSAWILANMAPAKRERLLRDLFTAEGCNLAALRLNMGASDYSPQYHLFRHIGPLVKRGARVLEAEGFRDGTRIILFRNPDGENVLVVVCDGSLVRGIERRRIVIKYKGLCKALPLPGGAWSVSTLVFK